MALQSNLRLVLIKRYKMLLNNKKRYMEWIEVENEDNRESEEFYEKLFKNTRSSNN